MRNTQSKSPKDLYLQALINRAHVLQFTGHYPQARQDWQSVDQATRDPKYRFEYYQGISSLYERIGKFRKAFALIEQAIRLCRRHPRLVRPHVLQHVQVSLLIEKDDFPAAVKLGEDLLRRWNRALTNRTRARLYTSLGTAHLAMGSYGRALDYYLKTRRLNQRVNYLDGISVADNNLALVYWKMGDYQKALEHSRAALEVREKIGYMFGISASLNNLGLINDELGNYDEALKYYEKALAAFKRLNDIYGITIALTNIGSIYHEIRGDVNRAFACHLRSLELARRSGDRYGEIEGLLIMTEMYWCQQNRRAYGQAIDAIAPLIKDVRSEELDVRYFLARIKLHAWQRNRSLRDRAIRALLKTLNRSRNRLLVMESIAVFINICHDFSLAEWAPSVTSRVEEIEKKLGTIESPLKRTKILRALVKYHLLMTDRTRATGYFRQWAQSARQYGIKAEQKDIDRLRSAVATVDSPFVKGG
jgi:tetratricopeptide (TPR) repeat protein